jgi:hypothetical protein
MLLTEGTVRTCNGGGTSAEVTVIGDSDRTVVIVE